MWGGGVALWTPRHATRPVELKATATVTPTACPRTIEVESTCEALVPTFFFIFTNVLCCKYAENVECLRVVVFFFFSSFFSLYPKYVSAAQRSEGGGGRCFPTSLMLPPTPAADPLLSPGGYQTGVHAERRQLGRALFWEPTRGHEEKAEQKV